ncbi:MAG: histidine phosphatase family protein [Anaerolineae bacterium]|jgi:broad specificity phosphatase PhoE
MPKLILVRHSYPDIEPTRSANRWSLSETGRGRCKPLADKLAGYQLEIIVTSVEPKAVETGQIVADLLGKPCETAQGLHEHERRDVGFGSRERFESSVADFFAQPRELVFGEESADQAHQRFSQAITNVIERYPHQNVAVVSHGTVMTLFVARAAGLEPFPFWKRLGLPAFVVLSFPRFDLLTIVEDVGKDSSVTMRAGRIRK